MKITAIVGTYRKGGVIDTAVGEILSAAREHGAETETIYLIDTHVEFCRNCRSCTQSSGDSPGVCPLNDEMPRILDALDKSDAFILASPMNFSTVTAVTKRFIERLVCFADWPWGRPAPRTRKPVREKRAVLVASSAAPAVLSRLATGMVKLMKSAAALLGAKSPDLLFIGMCAMGEHHTLSPRVIRRARRLGRKLAGGS
ncbi:MAG: flavodoxin family protein [Candidatus Hydrogenedens sp.]|nr:flavodoxin family protein [Candidatus Hydrogenedentota bacterium]NLF59193.1 flavodoxin family protein [Candidatus Hydrogenedens sp.]